MGSEDKLNIVVMTQGLDGAIPFYRLKQPLEWCRRKGLLDYTLLDIKKEIRDISNIILSADVCIWQSQTGWNAHKWITAMDGMNKEDKTNRISVFEYDDNLFDISPYNMKYNVFGTREVWWEIDDFDLVKYKKLANEEQQKIYELHQSSPGKWKFKPWKNGHDGMNLEENIDRIDGTKAIIKDCSLLTVTTKELGKKLIVHSGRTRPVAVLPNLLDFALWRPQKPNNTDKLRICWAGGNSHYRDWKIVEEALIEFYKEQPYTLVIAGQKFEGIHKKFKEIEFLGWHSDIRSYPMHMRDLRADIGICPLEGSEFDKGKSAIKWEEYSALEIPTIASNVTPYKEVIDDMKTGYLVANTTSAWLGALRQLSKDKELRTKLAKNANAEVRKNFSVERSIEWYEAYKALKPRAKKQLITASK